MRKETTEVDCKGGPAGRTLSGFYACSVRERLCLLEAHGYITSTDRRALESGATTLTLQGADRISENVIGVFGLPLGIATGLLLNGREYQVPLVTEEPSVIAALNSVFKIAREGEGFSSSEETVQIVGTVYLVGLDEPLRALRAIEVAQHDVIAKANALIPSMVGRGGGVRSISVRLQPLEGEDVLICTLSVDTRDAMGANVVNTVCEGIAPELERLSGGSAVLKILSNYCPDTPISAEVALEPATLATNSLCGEEVRDRIVLATKIAAIDSYRAVTHNKGVLNGVEALMLATGNDTRAVSAAAHAYASRSGKYSPLTTWRCDSDGVLRGRIEIGMKVGSVGAQMALNPGVVFARSLLKIHSAAELSAIAASVGLAQNLAALRALVTTGINAGHMPLHRRSYLHFVPSNRLADYYAG